MQEASDCRAIVEKKYWSYLVMCFLVNFWKFEI